MAKEKRPRNLEFTWSDDGTQIKGCAFHESIFVDGEFVRNEVTPITDWSKKALKPIADALNPMAVTQLNAAEAERDELKTQVETLTKERDDAKAETPEAVQTQIDTLTEQLAVAISDRDKAVAEVAVIRVTNPELEGVKKLEKQRVIEEAEAAIAKADADKAEAEEKKRQAEIEAE